MKTKHITSRYGKSRIITPNGHNIYTMEGEAEFYRVGMTDDNTKIAYFDPEGGPFIQVGSELDRVSGKITDIIMETAPEGKFKIRIEIDEDNTF